MKALVTGASGFVGYWVARKLLDAQYSVKVLLRSKPPTHLEKLAVEVCQGDLCDVNSLNMAMNGCDYIFHVAAHYKLWDKNPKLFYDVNVEGTRNLLSVASEHQIKRVVYTSSVATIKPSSDGTPANEDSLATLDDMIGHYKRSKYLAEMVAEEFIKEGLPIVIVNPSTPVGSFDVKPTPTGKIIVDYAKGKMSGYMDTGLNLVSVEDVADGHLLAAEKGEIGKRYILGDQNLRLIEIFKILEKITHVRAPRMKIPYSIAYLAGCMSEFWANCTGKTPDIPLDGVRMARKFMFFDSSRAMQALGYRPTSVENALEKSFQWFKENGHIS